MAAGEPAAAEQAWAHQALALASAAGPADEALAALIDHLDRAEDLAPGGLPLQLMARAVVAAGQALLRRGPPRPVAATVAAAQAYVDDPGEGTFAYYAEAATRSYPFGAGDGCYARAGRSDCGAGSGCRTGIGTLAAVAVEVGAPAVLAAVVEAWAPWLAASGHADAPP